MFFLFCFFFHSGIYDKYASISPFRAALANKITLLQPFQMIDFANDVSTWFNFKNLSTKNNMDYYTIILEGFCLFPPLPGGQSYQMFFSYNFRYKFYHPLLMQSILMSLGKEFKIMVSLKIQFSMNNGNDHFSTIKH